MRPYMNIEFIQLEIQKNKYVTQNGYSQVTRNIPSGSHIKSSNFCKNWIGWYNWQFLILMPPQMILPLGFILIISIH